MKVSTQTITDSRPIWAILLLLAIYTSSIVLSQSELILAHPEVFIGITYDLTILAPILYLVLIWSSRIPRITAVPVFIVGFLVASLVIPDYQDSHLQFIQLVVVPLVELTVFVFVLVKVRRIIREIKLQKKSDPDFYSVLKKASGNVLDSPKLGKIFATEIAMIYFGLFQWGRKKPKANQYTGFRENGIVAIFYTLIFLVVVETFVLHIVLIKWQATVAWIIFALSLYAGVQLLGHTKALLSRFTELKDNKLVLRYGLFGDAEIPFEDINSITISSENITGKTVKPLKMLGALESHNLLVELKAPVVVESVYGTSKKVDKILLHLDNHKEFIRQFYDKIDHHDEKK